MDVVGQPVMTHSVKDLSLKPPNLVPGHIFYNHFYHFLGLGLMA